MTDQSPEAPLRVLVVAPYGRDAESVAAVLRREQYEADILRTVAEIPHKLDDSAGVVLLTEEALAGGADGLGQALGRQPAWSDIPFILLATPRAGGVRGSEAAWLRMPATISNVIILERPLGAALLLSTIASAMRSRRRQFDLRDRLVELASSEERLRIATEASDVGTWDYDLSKDVLNWDARCKALFGLPPGATVTYEGTFVRGLHPEDRAATVAAVEGAFDPGGSGRYDVEYRTIGLEDGIERWLTAKGAAVFENGVAVRIAGTLMDVTQRHADEAALKAETRALETLNRNGQRLAAELDLDKLVQGVVEAATELTGARAAAFFYNRVDETGESYLLYALAGAPRAAFEQFPAPRNTAVFAPTFSGAGPVRSGDITKDERYGLSDTHWGMPKGHLKVVSYLAVPVVSRSGEVIGGLLFGHPEPDRFDERAERLAMGIAAQAATAIDNARLYQAAQRARETLEERVRERTAALEAEMTQREQAEAALRQSQKMEAVGQLTGGIAHDFNNMLTGVIGAMDIMQRRLESGRTDDLPRFMEAASASAQRAASLTSRLLAFSRRQSLDARPTDITALTVALEDLLRRSVRENVTLRIVPGKAVPFAIVDANQLENAILNLVLNARDAMPEGGQLTVETGVVEIDQAYAAAKPDVEPGRYVVVAVSDTGVGIAPDVLERVFEPFFSTKPMGQGTGLGLSMVYGFARQSGGQVRVHSRPGEGTSVKLYLPVASTGDAPAEAPSATVAIEGHGQSVLLVEDDPSVRILVREVLEELRYTTIEAGDAASAIPILASGQKIDLMVSDVGLPGMNGRQLAEIARQHRPHLPILFVTGYAENAAIRAGFLGTNMDMITKPFSIGALSAKISEMVPG